MKKILGALCESTLERGKSEGEALGRSAGLQGKGATHRGAVKVESKSTGVLGEEPTGLGLSVAGEEKDESTVMSEIPWVVEGRTGEGAC